MNTETELKVQAYLDNELSPGEARKIATLVSTDAHARALYQELKQTRELVAPNETPARLDASRDFYWSQIQRRIAAEEAAVPRKSGASAWWVKLMAPLAGAVALFAVLLSVSNQQRPASTGLAQASTSGLKSGPMHEIENTPEVSTITFRSEAEGVTVVWVSSQ